MEVPKPPPLDPTLSRADGATTPALTPRPPLPGPANSAELAVADAVAALVDQLHIHPLDLTGAMQIMIAEVRAELPLPGDARVPGAGPLPPGGTLSGGALTAGRPPAASAPQSLVQLFVQALPPPQTQEPDAWLAAVLQVERAMQVALDRGVAAVTAWRDVPVAVVEAATQTRAVVMAAITDDTPNPLWLRPEWLGLAPRLQQYWRRRKRARLRLSDPDPYWRERDEDRERREE